MASNIEIAPSPEKAQELGLSPETCTRLMALERYDLSFLTDNFNDDLIRQGRKFSVEQIYPIREHFGRADAEVAKRLEGEFKRFVAITMIRPGVTHAPSGPVDMYWHFFILHTREYKKFCEDIWGSGVPGSAVDAVHIEQETLVSQRLILRRFELDDAPEVQRLAGDEDVARYLTLVPHPYPDGYAEEWIRSHFGDFQKGAKAIYAVTTHSGQLIGSVQLGIFRPNDRGELGFWLGKPFWGHGFATEACRTLMDHGFDKLRLHRIQARHFTANMASARVLLRLSMRHEGHLRGDLKQHGTYGDSELYAALAEDAVPTR